MDLGPSPCSLVRESHELGLLWASVSSLVEGELMGNVYPLYGD